MAVTRIPLGRNAKVYVSATEQQVIGSMTELSKVKDVNVNLESDKIDGTVRANGGFNSTDVGHTTVSVDFQMREDPTDAQYVIVRTAFLNKTMIELAALTKDKATSGSNGPKGTFCITRFSRVEPLKGEVMVNVVADLNTYDQWVSV